MKAKEGNNKKEKTLLERKPSDIVVKTNLENSFDTRWAEIKIQGKNISSRSNHASVVHENRLYIHGGFDADKGMLADFNCIDLSESAVDYRWIKLNNTCDGQPIKLKSHTAEVHGEHIYLIGGQKNPMNSNNLVFVYSIKNDTWSKIVPNIAVPKVDSHASVVWEGKIYIYGGYIPEIATFMTDIYAFSLEKKTWELYYKGGSVAEQPQGRSDFDMVVQKGIIWLFGGSNGKKTLDDFWNFDIKLNKWSRVKVQDGPDVTKS